MNVSGPDYVNYCITYIEAILDDPTVFPATEDGIYPADFLTVIREIYVKMFRIFSILYGAFLETLKGMDVTQHLNTSFKHYVFFGLCHELMPSDKEVTPLANKVKEFREQYFEGMRKVPKEHKGTKSFHAMDLPAGAEKEI